MRLDWEPLQEPAFDHGSGQTRMPPQERRHEGENQPPRAIHSRGGTEPNDHSCGRPAQRIKPSPQFAGWGGAARGGFFLGDSFTRPGAPIRRRHAAGATRRGLMRFLVFLVLWRASRERIHERSLSFVLRALRGREWSEAHAASGGTARGGFWFGGSGAWERHRFNGGAVAVCFEGDCRSMCWPVDRPATHAAAGAAARGVLIFFVWGDYFAFGLRAVAGAWVGRWTGQPRMPPQERRHEGLGGLGGFFHTPWSNATPPCGGAGEDEGAWAFSHIKPEVHYVAVAHNVIPPLLPQFAGVARRRFAA